MDQSLIKIILEMEDAIDILLLLRHSPQEMDALSECLAVDSQALLPQLQVLEGKYLICACDGGYELTAIGKLVVEQMVPLLDKLEIVIQNGSYFNNHKLDFIPGHLLSRLEELGPGKVIHPPPVEIYEPNKKFIDQIKDSSFLLLITSSLFSESAKMLAELNDNGVDVSVIFSAKLYDHILQHKPRDLERLAGSLQSKFYRYPHEIGVVSSAQNGHCLKFRMLSCENEYNYKQIIFSDQSAIKWGKDLFEHYRQQSTPVDKI
jgi:predicted transcriptional regulator